MRSEELQQLSWQAEDNGQDVYVQRHEVLDVIEYIEIDGKEIYNTSYHDEVSDAYWAADAERVADHYWRQ